MRLFAKRLKPLPGRDFKLWMWNTATRGRMVAIEKKTKRYPSDLTDEEWGRSTACCRSLRRGGASGRPTFGRSLMRCVTWCAQDASGGCFLSAHFPPWQTVYWWFRRFVRLLLFRTIHDVVLMIDRERAGREASPTAGGHRQPDHQGADG